MPLLDHFHPPLSTRRKWHSFLHAWATVIAFDLNRQLPPGYFADLTAQFGIEIDVAAFEEEKGDRAPPSWTPPAPTLTVPMTLLTDVVEVEVLSTEAGPVLIGAIELVSPANKDRAAHRDAFVSKCASLLQQVVGLIVVNMVTDRRADLHADLVQRLSGSDPGARSTAPWAAAYRPWQEVQETRLEIWREDLAVGAALPTLPFWLKKGPCLKIDLEATYLRTCLEERLVPRVPTPESA
jgi:hypothetical protein